MSRSQGKQENIFLFVPNLIGYTRIIFAVGSLYYMPYHPRTCSLLYSISCLLDALDGAAARRLDQSTRFGAVLDMVTDRCTTTCLLVFLASAFPRWSIVFQTLISLDYSSHYIHMYATLIRGDRRSHKEVDDGWPWALRIYYANTNVLFAVCLFNELFFIALYLLSFSSDATSSAESWSSAWSAGAMEMARANKIDSYWPRILFSVSLPIMLYKQVVNVVQLVQASRWIAQGDIEARQKGGK
ncbi:CDP-alcohol phosphatidyltransferase-domain-containing protein [Aspergillus pseudoustus]|uniref:CDP-diacylglycerol--inositol 3-phosphatidyltransferase n=1 Tax=Aspergillus pseudoustus TaxID=1810923 RepID=A0ABR4KEE9_9EURO